MCEYNIHLFWESAVSAETVCIPAKVVRHNMPVSANAAQFFSHIFLSFAIPRKNTLSPIASYFPVKIKSKTTSDMIAVLLFFVFTILHKFYIDVKKSHHFYICFLYVRSLQLLFLN